MSGDGSGEVLKPFLLRSSTPAPNEKVLNYLEGMSREGNEVDRTPPRSMVDPNEYRSRSGSAWNGLASPKIHSPAPKSRASELLELANSPMSYTNLNGGVKDQHAEEDDGDADSNIQDGLRSEDGGTILPVREPGPHDPPGPKYESYDSGPSFGNFGPLPMDDHAASNNPFAHSVSRNREWTRPPPQAYNNGEASMSGIGLTPGGQAAYTAGLSAKAPLPTSEFGASPRGTTVNIDVEGPSSPSRGQTPKAMSYASDRRGSPPEGPSSPKDGSRAPSRVAADQRPLSPLSRVTGRTRATEKGTAYPMLPESRMGDDETNFDTPASPTTRSQLRHKAASISPSDSPSNAIFHQKQSRKDPSNYEAGAEFSPRSGTRQMPQNGASRSQALGSVMSGGGHQSRPFSPYRHAPTTEDLLHAAVRGRALAIPEEDEKSKAASVVQSQLSKTPSAMQSRHNKAPSHGGKTASQVSTAKQPSAVGSKHVHGSRANASPRPPSPGDLDLEEARIVNEALANQTPRTSYYAASALDPAAANHFHDLELCVLLHQESDSTVHEVVKKALRKAVRQRIKRLGMKYDNESIRQYKKSYHDHDPSVHLRPDSTPDEQEPPKWASDIKREIVLMQQRIESLGPKIEGLRSPVNGPNRSFGNDGSRFAYGYEGDDYASRTPQTQTVNIHTAHNGNFADSMYQPAETEVIVDDQEDDDRTETQHRGIPRTDGETRTQNRSNYAMSDDHLDVSPGHQVLEEELYKLKQKPQGSQSALSHRTWEVARDDDHEEEQYDDEEGHDHEVGASGLPTIPDTNAGGFPNREGSTSPPLPALPQEEGSEGGEMVAPLQQHWHAAEYSNEAQQQLPPWQRIHQRLLSWAIIWPSSELDHALNSTTRGHQVDEVALSIWSTQTYKRYVRARLTDSPQGVVDRLFVPPNMADAISTAVFNGRHGDACGMLRDLWSPFGLEGMPRLLVVLAKHRSDENHWVVHRFSLPDGALTTYDSYPERTLPDGRPLGWWFAIRVAWPNAIYPSPDHLMQKMVRLHRPMQLPIDNSVAAAGIWRNILMGSRAERSLDLERLRDLINTEVKNLRQRKQLGKLSIGAPRPTWEDMN